MKQINIQFLNDPYPHKRDAFQKIESFFEKKNNGNQNYRDKILVLYGLKRTGKTTLLEQTISKIKKNEKCAYYLADSSDNMDVLEETIEKEQKKGTKYFFVDEITSMEGFVDESASLSNLYSKEGMIIILSGTDSLGFHLAGIESLSGKTVKIGTTHIPFAEYCRVLDIKDMDEYIKFGGLMTDGKTDDGDNGHFVDDYDTTLNYLKSVANNISHSLKKSPNTSCLERPTEDELSVIIRKVVEKFSGVLDEKILQNTLKKASVTFVNEKMEEVKKEGDFDLDDDFIHRMNQESIKKAIAKDFLPEINADTAISTTVTQDMVEWMIYYLSKMGVLSTVKKHAYTKSENGVWSGQLELNEYYIVQPAIKYYHLLKAKEFLKNSSWYSDLSPDVIDILGKKLEEKIMGDMLEQIVLFDTTCYLSKYTFTNDNGVEEAKYVVCKPTFTMENHEEESKQKAEYDMLIQNKESGEYYAFEIKHSKKAIEDQCKHLINEEVKEVVDKQYKERKNVCVLYRGDPFSAPNGVTYLNVNQFLLTLDKYRDIEKTMNELTQGLEKREFDSSPIKGDNYSTITNDEKHLNENSPIPIESDSDIDLEKDEYDER